MEDASSISPDLHGRLYAHICTIAMRIYDSRSTGDRLRRRMRAEGISQKQVAAEHGVSQPRISRILAGQFTKRSKLAEQLCRRFDVRPDEPTAPDAHTADAQRAFEAAQGLLRDLWDETVPGAARLQTLLRAVLSVTGH